MGRYIGSACKQCRREGMKLFLKGDRCYMAKCPIETGRPVPGGQPRRRPRISDYGMQLREKQRLRRMYGMSETQFRIFFARAEKTANMTGESLLQLLEMRLDNLVYRFGFAPSRKAARQFVRHGHVTVNGSRASIPSMTLTVGDVVQVASRQASRDKAERFLALAESRGIASWLSLEKTEFRGEIEHIPSREEIAPIVNERMIVELYSK